MALNLLLAIIYIQKSQETIGNISYEFDLSSATDSIEIVGEGIISSRFNERDFAISADGTQIFFTQSNYNHTIRAIMSTSLSLGSFSEPEIAPFSGQYNDIEPFLSPDGARLYFASDRPIDSLDQTLDYNIWYVDFINYQWGPPVVLSPIINTPNNEYYPSVTKSGNLYFTATRENGIGSEDIFVSMFEDGEFGVPQPLDSTINSKTYEFNAFVSPDEDLIIFSSFGRSDDVGGGDLYYSKKKCIRELDTGRSF